MKSKKNVVVLILLIVFLTLIIIFGVALSSRSAGGGVTYPASTLDEKAGKTIYQGSDLLTKELSCKELPYILSLPGSAQEVNNTFYAKISDQLIVAVEECSKDKSPSDMIESTYLDLYQLPARWEPVIEDVGYINGYGAIYGAGKVILNNNGKESTQYAILYELKVPESETCLFIDVSTTTPKHLLEAKGIADSIVYALSKESHIVSDLGESPGAAVSIKPSEEKPVSTEKTDVSSDASGLGEVNTGDIGSEVRKRALDVIDEANKYTDPANPLPNGQIYDLGEYKGYAYYVEDAIFKDVPAGQKNVFIMNWDKEHGGDPILVTVTDGNGNHYDTYDPTVTDIENGIIGITVDGTVAGDYFIRFLTLDTIANQDCYMFSYENYQKYGLDVSYPKGEDAGLIDPETYEKVYGKPMPPDLLEQWYNR